MLLRNQTSINLKVRASQINFEKIQKRIIGELAQQSPELEVIVALMSLIYQAKVLLLIKEDDWFRNRDNCLVKSRFDMLHS